MTLIDLRNFALVTAAFMVPPIAHAQQSAPLTWIAGDFSGEHNRRVALAVTARVAGRPCQLQLDTGVNEAVRLYGGTPSVGKTVPLPVDFMGISVTVPTSVEVAARLNECQQGQLAGTLGNAFFESGSLTLDLRSSKVSFTPKATLAKDERAQPLFYARWTPHGGHPLVELRRAGVLEGYVLLDTGSAASGFAPLSRAQWDAATGSAPLAATNSVREFAVSSWGRTLKCYSTQGAAPLLVGSWPLDALPVTYCPELDFIPPVKLEGLVGLGGFTQAVITIDYLSGRWLVDRSR